MLKLAIIGASYLQYPLIVKARSMGIETHVFAWVAGDIGEKAADHFYPISIVEKDLILDECRRIGIDGICSIASDLANITVNYVAEHMGLICNGIENTILATDKHAMRECFFANGDPSPRSVEVTDVSQLHFIKFDYPVIVKPVDRSGSRGITKVKTEAELESAYGHAFSQSFCGRVLVEEFAEGEEYSVECISWNGTHNLLAVTKKYTTGDPDYIEKAHMEPAFEDDKDIDRIRKVVYHALSSLKIKYGASHTEIKIDDEGNIRIIEIGARMGGDLIGSSLVRLSSGVDFVRLVIETALGIEPSIVPGEPSSAGVRYIFTEKDLQEYELIKRNDPEIIVEESDVALPEGNITDSSARKGYFVVCSKDRDRIIAAMPQELG